MSDSDSDQSSESSYSNSEFPDHENESLWSRCVDIEDEDDLDNLTQFDECAPNVEVDQEDMNASASGNAEAVEPYADEPLADDEWLELYNQHQEAEEQEQLRLRRRLENIEPLNTWCNCGNCGIELLQNPYECLCCTEIEQCKEALNHDLVIQEVLEPPTCITSHLGFRPICLEAWSLRMAADKFRRKKYKQCGSQEKFLRAVSYREFTRLVHGHLGQTRRPLPACAYNAIRQQFCLPKDGLVGYIES